MRYQTVHTEDFKGAKIVVEICEEDTRIRGNAVASGDDAEDKEIEDKIIEDLENGNLWAWASVRVTASLEAFEASDYLGCCSYRNTEDFLAGGYFEDMRGLAFEDLKKQIAASLEKLTSFVEA